jgi:hypothetical protein
MKKLIASSLLMVLSNSMAQEHFAGYNTSNRIGVVQSSYHPALLSFQTNKFDVQFGGLNASVSNNKLGTKDIFNDNFESKLWEESSPISFRIDAEVIGIGAAFKYNNWGFGLLFKSNIKMNLTDINSKLGNAIINGSDDLAIATSLLNVKENQRINATVWSEIGASVSRTIINKDNHFLSIGTTLKLLMPASYANFGLSNLNANLNSTLTNDVLASASGNLNIAYSGNLANDFTNSKNYTQSIFGKPNGFAIDFGTAYQMVDDEGVSKFTISASVRNIGSMTFTGADNKNQNYRLNGTNINLNDYQNISSFKELETKLINDGHLIIVNGTQDIKVNLPATFNFLATAKLISKFHASINLQQKLNDTQDNDQINSINFVTITPKLVFKNFELYLPLSNNEIAGFTGGFGLRAGGFYIGSGSVLTAIASDTKQMDLFFGFSLGL